MFIRFIVEMLVTLTLFCYFSSTNAYMLMYRQVDKDRNTGEMLYTHL